MNITSESRTFCDPLSAESNLRAIQVQSVFNSNARPLLLSLYCGQALSSQLVFKLGDDLRKDASTLTMFRLFNDIWRLCGLNAECVTYRCVPMGQDYGCIEYVPGCIPLTDIKVC